MYSKQPSTIVAINSYDLRNKNGASLSEKVLIRPDTSNWHKSWIDATCNFHYFHFLFKVGFYCGIVPFRIVFQRETGHYKITRLNRLQKVNLQINFVSPLNKIIHIRFYFECPGHVHFDIMPCNWKDCTLTKEIVGITSKNSPKSHSSFVPTRTSSY